MFAEKVDEALATLGLSKKESFDANSLILAILMAKGIITYDEIMELADSFPDLPEVEIS